MSATYDQKGIAGAELKEILKGVSKDINTKQDIIDAEYDSANGMIVLNNVNIVATEST